MNNEALKTALRNKLWERAEVASWYLREHQIPLYEALQAVTRDFLCFNVARRFGKSTTISVDCDERCRKDKPIHIDYATAFLVDVEKFILPVFSNIHSTCPEHLRPRYLKSKKTFIYPNGSTIQLIGLDKNPDAVRGNTIDHLVIDEASEVSALEYLYKSVIVPATANRDFRIIFSSTPPKDSEHFILELQEVAKIRGNYKIFTIEDNKSIGERERERLFKEMGGRDSVYVRREFYCETVRDPKSTIVPEFSDNNVYHMEMPEHYYPQTTVDFGGSVDKTGIIIGYFDFIEAKYIVVQSALVEANTTTAEIVDKIYEMEGQVYPKDARIGRVIDCFGQTRTDLGALKFYSGPPKKEKGSVEANINQMRISFQNDKLVILPTHNDELIATLQLGQYTKSGDFKRTEKLGHCDLLAALSYAWRERRLGNPYPHLADTTDVLRHINRKKMKSKQGNILTRSLYDD